MFPGTDAIQDVLRSFVGDNPDIGLAVGMVSTSDAPEGVYAYEGSIKSYTGQPLTLGDTTLFEIASISKTFCATLFAHYWAAMPSLAGTMVSDYHPKGTTPLDPTKFGAMPLLSLANYTSGLPHDPIDPHDQPKHLKPPYTVPHMYGYLGRMDWSPGTSGVGYSYSNLGFALLGESLAPAIESSDSYAQLIQVNVLEPLGFSSATTMYSSDLVSQLPQGYKADGDPGGPGWPVFPAYFGAGGLVTTPADLMIWLRYNMGLTGPADMLQLLPKLQKPSTTVRTKEQDSQLGLGWFITPVLTSSGTLDIVWKNGGLAGFSSYITFLPSSEPGVKPSDAGVFVLSNSNTPEVDSIAVVLLSLLSGGGSVPPGVRLRPY